MSQINKPIISANPEEYEIIAATAWRPKVAGHYTLRIIMIRWKDGLYSTNKQVEREEDMVFDGGYYVKNEEIARQQFIQRSELEGLEIISKRSE